MPSLCKSQSGVWTWMGGPQGVDRVGVYGVRGVPNANNTPPGTYEAANWIDLDGNFWVFGGVIDSGFSNLLWKYDPQINMWTWVNGSKGWNFIASYGIKGVPAPSNNPGGRAFASLTWTDTLGDLWLYGGVGFDSMGNYVQSDLWKYHIITNEWTWMSGQSIGDGDTPVYGIRGVPSANNTPGARMESHAAWVDDDDNLWLYGGEGYGDGFSDMWYFNIAQNQWVWMSGPQGPYVVGSYGSKNIESSNNLPPGRSAYTHWKDTLGNFYLFGGINWANENTFNDVWRYNASTHRWCWVAGEKSLNSLGIYQQPCIWTKTQEPMSRFENQSPQVFGKSNFFIEYGGEYADTLGNFSALADLWLYSPRNNEWNQLHSNTTNGHYGVYRVPDLMNNPPGRAGSCQWIDKFGNFWVWGGYLAFSDLWRFTFDCSCVGGPVIIPEPIKYQLSDSVLCQGDTVFLTLKNVFNCKVEPQNLLFKIDSNNYLLFPDSNQPYTISGQTATCGPIESSIINVHVLPSQVNLTSDKNNICSYDSVELCAPTGFTNYLWSTGQTSLCIYSHTSGIYNVTVSTNNCSEVSDNFSVHVLTVVSASISISGDTLIASDADDYQWYLNNTAIAGATSKTYLASVSGIYAVQITDSNGCIVISDGQLNIYSLSDNHIKIFPNPTTTNWQIVVGPEWLGSEGEVYDELGRLIFRVPINNLQTTVDLGSIASAVYELRITQSGYSIVRKLVKLQE